VKRVAWFAVARTPYNDFLFESLAKRVDLTVVYTHKHLESHPWQFEGAPIRTLYVHDELAKCVSLARSADAIVFSGWHDPRYLLLMALLPRSTPKAFWTDTPRPARRGARDVVRSAVLTWVFRAFDQVWSTGRVGCESLAALGCPREKIRSLPFFYDLTRYEKLTDSRRREAARFREERAPRDAVVFVGAGQLAKKKRFDDAVRAIARPGNEKAVLWLCGVGAEEGALRELARELGVADRVTLLGWLQPAELELALVAADVFVHPAALDPFPTVVLDAMTWGKPVVGTDVAGSVVDRVVSGENGFVYPEGDVDALARHMAFFVADRGAIERFHQAARATACKYPVDVAFDRLDELMGVPPSQAPGPERQNGAGRWLRT
jgi:glycosyltransferase involved in cell wall biosynthesis